MALWSSEAETVVQSSLMKAKIEALSDWRDKMDERRDWYTGDQDGLIREVLRNDCPQTDIDALRRVPFGFTRKIVDSTAQVYWQAPTRELTSAKSGDVLDAEDAISLHWADLVNKGRLDAVLRDVDRMARLYVSSYLWVQHDEERECLKWSPIKPQDLYVEQDPDEPGSISRCRKVYFPLANRVDTTDVGSTDKQLWIGISQDEWIKAYGDVSDAGVDLEPAIDGGPNPYGRIPLTGFYDCDTNSLFPEGNHMITGSNEVACGMFSGLYDLILMQASGQAIIKSVYPIDKAGIGPRKALHLKGAGDTFEFASPGAQIQQFREAIEWSLKAFSNVQNLPPSAFSTEARELSGYAMALENLPLTRFNQERQALFAAWERDLWELTKIVNDAHLTPKFGDTEQSVTFADLDYPADPAAEWMRDKEMIEMGIKSPLDLIMDLHPDMDADEAAERYEKNLADKKAQAAASQPPRFSVDFGKKRKPPEAEEEVEEEVEA